MLAVGVESSAGWAHPLRLHPGRGAGHGASAQRARRPGASVHGLEVLSQVDINRDGVIGKPDERLILVNKPVPDDRLRWRRFITEAAIDSTVPGLESKDSPRSQIEVGRTMLIRAGVADGMAAGIPPAGRSPDG